MRYEIESVKRELRWAYESLQRECRFAMGTNPRKAAEFSKAAAEICEAIDAVDRRDFYRAKQIIECTGCPGYVDRSIVFKLRELIREDERPQHQERMYSGVPASVVIRHAPSAGSDSTDAFLGAAFGSALSLGLGALASLLCTNMDKK